MILDTIEGAIIAGIAIPLIAWGIAEAIAAYVYRKK